MNYHPNPRNGKHFPSFNIKAVSFDVLFFQPEYQKILFQGEDYNQSAVGLFSIFGSCFVVKTNKG